MRVDDFHAVTGQILDLLDAAGCWYETFVHEPVRTSAEAAKTRPGYGLHQGAKAIILRIKRSKNGQILHHAGLPGRIKNSTAWR